MPCFTMLNSLATPCFSRSIEALRRAVKLFVYASNRRQLHKRAYPSYAAHIMDFVCS